MLSCRTMSRSPGLSTSSRAVVPRSAQLSFNLLFISKGGRGGAELLGPKGPTPPGPLGALAPRSSGAGAGAARPRCAHSSAQVRAVSAHPGGDGCGAPRSPGPSPCAETGMARPRRCWMGWRCPAPRPARPPAGPAPRGSGSGQTSGRACERGSARGGGGRREGRWGGSRKPEPGAREPQPSEGWPCARFTSKRLSVCHRQRAEGWQSSGSRTRAPSGPNSRAPRCGGCCGHLGATPEPQAAEAGDPLPPAPCPGPEMVCQSAVSWPFSCACHSCPRPPHPSPPVSPPSLARAHPQPLAGRATVFQPTLPGPYSAPLEPPHLDSCAPWGKL